MGVAHSSAARVELNSIIEVSDDKNENSIGTYPHLLNLCPHIFSPACLIWSGHGKRTHILKQDG